MMREQTGAFTESEHLEHGDVEREEEFERFAHDRRRPGQAEAGLTHAQLCPQTLVHQQLREPVVQPVIWYPASKITGTAGGDARKFRSNNKWRLTRYS